MVYNTLYANMIMGEKIKKTPCEFHNQQDAQKNISTNLNNILFENYFLPFSFVIIVVLSFMTVLVGVGIGT